MTKKRQLSTRETESPFPGQPVTVAVTINHVPNPTDPAYDYREIAWRYASRGGGQFDGSLQVRRCSRHGDPNERVQFEIYLNDGHNSMVGSVALNDTEARLFAAAILG